MTERIYRKDLKECKEHKGYYFVPLKEKIIVNKLGDVRYFNNFEKPKLTLTSGYIRTTGFTVHSLICETFLVKPKPDHTGKVFINHKNGIKHDNRLSNLEWCTPKENLVHSYSNGLRNDNIPILVKNLENGVIEKYYSYGDCARKFNTKPSNIWHWLQSKQYGIIKLEKYLFIKEGQEWPNVNIEDSNKFYNGFSKQIVLINEKENKYYLFASVGVIVDHLKINITPAAISKRLRTAKQNNKDYCHLDEYKIMYKSDFLKKYNIQPIKINKTLLIGNKINKRKPFKIKVLNIINGDTRIYNSREELAKHLNLNKNIIMTRIFRNNGMVTKDLYAEYIKSIV